MKISYYLHSCFRKLVIVWLHCVCDISNRCKFWNLSCVSAFTVFQGHFVHIHYCLCLPMPLPVKCLDNIYISIITELLWPHPYYLNKIFEEWLKIYFSLTFYSLVIEVFLQNFEAAKLTFHVFLPASGYCLVMPSPFCLWFWSPVGLQQPLQCWLV